MPIELPRSSSAQTDPTAHQSAATGWLEPTDNYLRTFLARPELAPVPESCKAELALHAALQAAPARPVSSTELQAISDTDARDSYTLFLRFRDGLLAAGTLEAHYLSLFQGTRAGRIDIAPLFIDLLAAEIMQHVMGPAADAYEARAADMLHRAQRISTENGQVLSGDQATLDMLSETRGVGDFGRFLIEAGAPLETITMQVLNDEPRPDFQNDACALWSESAVAGAAKVGAAFFESRRHDPTAAKNRRRRLALAHRPGRRGNRAA
jgi:hypothetical protein